MEKKKRNKVEKRWEKVEKLEKQAGKKVGKG